MDFLNLHPWKVTAKEAIRIQEKLCEHVILEDDFGEVRVIAGADVAFNNDEGYAGVIVYTFPELEELERKAVRKKVDFPYIPGLLAFREAPVLLDAFSLLTTEPDMVLFDGQGIAHFRRMGIATHLGLVLNKPTIGCAKSRLIGTYEEPERKEGSYTPLMDGNQTVGAVLRTRKDVQPIFVSPGHKVSLQTSISIVLKCVDGYRVPRPTREADRYVALLKKAD